MPQYTIEVKDSSGKVLYSLPIVLLSDQVGGLIRLIDSTIETAYPNED